MQSMPWILKAMVLGSNIYAQSRRSAQEQQMHEDQAADKTVQRIVMIVVVFEFIFMLSSILPSLMFSVQHRKNTTKNICLQILYHLNTYILLCSLFREKHVAPLLHITAQFLYVHLHYWQARMLRKNNKLQLFGGVFAILHSMCIWVVPLICLCLVRSPLSTTTSVENASTANTFLLWLLLVFIPEIVATCTVILNMLLSAAAEVYESNLEAY